MKPMRRVMSSAHMIAYRLSCGHTVCRPPLSGKMAIPERIGCEHCQHEAFRKFDMEQAVARAREDATKERGASGTGDLVELTESALAEMRRELTQND